MAEPSQHHREFTIERIYYSCPEHVWAAWSIKEKKNAWLRGEHMEMDFRPGGLERRSFRDKMGEHVNETRYFEIKERERIVLAYSMSVNGRIHTVSLATILFEDQNGGTKLTYHEQMCVIPPSDGVEGRRQGWNAILGSLEDYLATDKRVAV